MSSWYTKAFAADKHKKTAEQERNDVTKAAAISAAKPIQKGPAVRASAKLSKKAKEIGRRNAEKSNKPFEYKPLDLPTDGTDRPFAAAAEQAAAGKSALQQQQGWMNAVPSKDWFALPGVAPTNASFMPSVPVSNVVPAATVSNSAPFGENASFFPTESAHKTPLGPIQRKRSASTSLPPAKKTAVDTETSDAGKAPSTISDEDHKFMSPASAPAAAAPTMASDSSSVDIYNSLFPTAASTGQSSPLGPIRRKRAASESLAPAPAKKTAGGTEASDAVRIPSIINGEDNKTKSSNSASAAVAPAMAPAAVIPKFTFAANTNVPVAHTAVAAQTFPARAPVPAAESSLPVFPPAHPAFPTSSLYPITKATTPISFGATSAVPTLPVSAPAYPPITNALPQTSFNFSATAPSNPTITFPAPAPASIAATRLTYTFTSRLQQQPRAAHAPFHPNLFNPAAPAASVRTIENPLGLADWPPRVEENLNLPAPLPVVTGSVPSAPAAEERPDVSAFPSSVEAEENALPGSLTALPLASTEVSASDAGPSVGGEGMAAAEPPTTTTSTTDTAIMTEEDIIAAFAEDLPSWLLLPSSEEEEGGDVSPTTTTGTDTAIVTEEEERAEPPTTTTTTDTAIMTEEDLIAAFAEDLPSWLLLSCSEDEEESDMSPSTTSTTSDTSDITEENIIAAFEEEEIPPTLPSPPPEEGMEDALYDPTAAPAFASTGVDDDGSVMDVSLVGGEGTAAEVPLTTATTSYMDDIATITEEDIIAAFEEGILPSPPKEVKENARTESSAPSSEVMNFGSVSDFVPFTGVEGMAAAMPPTTTSTTNTAVITEEDIIAAFFRGEMSTALSPPPEEGKEIALSSSSAPSSEGRDSGSVAGFVSFEGREVVAPVMPPTTTVTTNTAVITEEDIIAAFAEETPSTLLSSPQENGREDGLHGSSTPSLEVEDSRFVPGFAPVVGAQAMASTVPPTTMIPTTTFDITSIQEENNTAAFAEKIPSILLSPPSEVEASVFSSVVPLADVLVITPSMPHTTTTTTTTTTTAVMPSVQEQYITASSAEVRLPHIPSFPSAEQGKQKALPNSPALPTIAFPEVTHYTPCVAPVANMRIMTPSAPHTTTPIQGKETPSAIPTPPSSPIFPSPLCDPSPTPAMPRPRGPARSAMPSAAERIALRRRKLEEREEEERQRVAEEEARMKRNEEEKMKRDLEREKMKKDQEEEALAALAAAAATAPPVVEGEFSRHWREALARVAAEEERKRKIMEEEEARAKEHEAHMHLQAQFEWAMLLWNLLSIFGLWAFSVVEWASPTLLSVSTYMYVFFDVDTDWFFEPLGDLLDCLGGPVLWGLLMYVLVVEKGRKERWRRIVFSRLMGWYMAGLAGDLWMWWFGEEEGIKEKGGMKEKGPMKEKGAMKKKKGVMKEKGGRRMVSVVE